MPAISVCRSNQINRFIKHRFIDLKHLIYLCQML